MKKTIGFILFFFLTCFISEAQVKKKVVYTDYQKYRKAYQEYVDSIKIYKTFQIYVNAVRNIEKGLSSKEYNKLDDALEKKIFKDISISYSTKERVEFNQAKNKNNIENGLIVFVNYTVDENSITNRYVEISPYPVLKPIYKKTQPSVNPVINIKMVKPIFVTEIKTVKKDTVNSIMLMDGNIYTVSEFDKIYGRKPLNKIFEK